MTSAIQRATEQAQQILARGVYTPPIDVHQVARDLGLVVIEQDLEDHISGLLVIKDSQGTIAVNKSHHLNRQRFSIAHEIGHYVLHAPGGGVFIDATPVFFRDTISQEGRSLEEIAANTFAAELLMPHAQLLEILRREPLDAFDDGALRRVAGMFGVSAQALTIRLTRLGLISIG
jgi:Zn-dependent peptidase ImmA (M78 family)